MLTTEQWLEKIIKPHYDSLPGSALVLSDCYFGYYLWLTDEMDLPGKGKEAHRLSILYRVVDKLELRPFLTFGSAIKGTGYWSAETKTCKGGHFVPEWLVKYLPDSDFGYKRRDYTQITLGFFQATYFSPWLALETAAMDCPDFYRHAAYELYGEYPSS